MQAKLQESLLYCSSSFSCFAARSGLVRLALVVLLVLTALALLAALDALSSFLASRSMIVQVSKLLVLPR